MSTPSCGFIYVAVRRKYYLEAQISARSLRRFTKYPIHLVTDCEEAKDDPLFDQVTMVGPEFGTGFVVKIRALQANTFERAVFMDVDTFVAEPVDDLFTVLDYYDMAMTQGPAHHSDTYWTEFKPDYHLRYKSVIPEFNTGVIAFKRNPATSKLFDLWLQRHIELDIDADMPTFREAYLDAPVHIGVLPREYNFFGMLSLAIAEDRVRIIHGRIGERWNNLRPHVPDFDTMERYAKSINTTHIKRLIVPYVGAVPYYWSPYNIKKKLKRMVGIKMKRKAETF